MASKKETVDQVLANLGQPALFSSKTMFGEHALYASGVMVGLICDDRLYIKDVAASASLSEHVSKGGPYPGAKLHWKIEVDRMSAIGNLPTMLVEMSIQKPVKTAAKSSKKAKTKP
jgi:TfoX/Sxy family transcriptional regulator of competence genes